MVNKPKAIGTAAETAVRRYYLSLGFTEKQVHRNVLAGSQDQGDLWLRFPQPNHPIVIEVKAGHTAETASHNQVLMWFEEALQENRNSRGSCAVLVLKRKGVSAENAGNWWAYYLVQSNGPNLMVRSTLSEHFIHYIKPLWTPGAP